MLGGDLVHDRQAQAGAIHIGAQRTVERLEHLLALGWRDARPGVFDLQYHHLAERVIDHTHGDHAARGRVLQCVVHQVANQLAQQQCVAAHQQAVSMG